MNLQQLSRKIRYSLTRIKNISLMLLLLPISFFTNATDLHASMSVQPEQCVAMRQGQSCYVSVELTWQVKAPGNYCLHIAGQDKAVNCWQNTAKGEFKHDFNSKVNLAFSLRKQHEQFALATAVVKMAWVHKKKGQARKSWRLF